jgi:hypothetical protein
MCIAGLPAGAGRSLSTSPFHSTWRWQVVTSRGKTTSQGGGENRERFTMRKQRRGPPLGAGVPHWGLGSPTGGWGPPLGAHRGAERGDGGINRRGRGGRDVPAENETYPQRTQSARRRDERRDVGRPTAHLPLPGRTTLGVYLVARRRDVQSALSSLSSLSFRLSATSAASVPLRPSVSSVPSVVSSPSASSVVRA